MFLSYVFFGLIPESTLCQHGKKDDSCCGSSCGNGSGSKPNSASKESKVIKPKKQNWGIKLNCTKLKGIKSLSSSPSSECKYFE